MGKYVENEIRSKELIANKIECRNTLHSNGFEYIVEYDWFKMPDNGTTYNVCGMVCDREDYVYLAVRHPKFRIMVFTPDGVFDHFLGNDIDMGIAHGISINSDGNVWIADDYFNTIQLIDKNTGKVLQVLGKKGKSSNTGVKDYWKGDSNAHLTIKRLGGPFNRPTRLIEASNGKLYVSDGYWNCAVHCFSHEGIYEKSWGGHGCKNEQFFLPHSIWQDKRGRIWIADRNQDRITAFDVDGNYITSIKKLMMPADVWSDEFNIYVIELDRRISIFDMDCNLVAQLGYAASLFLGHHMTGDSKGNLYLNYCSPVKKLIRLKRVQ